ncbi:MAG: hypothetical protein ACK55I_28500, partial [bacterium]
VRPLRKNSASHAVLYATNIVTIRLAAIVCNPEGVEKTVTTTTLNIEDFKTRFRGKSQHKLRRRLEWIPKSTVKAAVLHAGMHEAHACFIRHQEQYWAIVVLANQVQKVLIAHFEP